MRTSMLSLTALAVAIAGVGCEGPDAVTDPVTVFEAGLIGGNEVPADTSLATADGDFTLNAAGTAVTYTITMTRATVTAVTQAHLHQAAAGATAAAGPWLCGTAAFPGPAGTPTCGTGAVGVLATGTVTITTAQLNAIRAFGMYANVHTTRAAGGEIRGQLRIVR